MLMPSRPRNPIRSGELGFSCFFNSALFGYQSSRFKLNEKELASMTKRFRPHIKTLQSFQSGPLGTHLERFASLLIQKGYSSEAGWDKIRLVADLSRWMVQKNVRLEELDEKRTTTFLGWR